MAPFPEAEIMTIKRLEVALRKLDFKLLKDGAYKLHEKFHAGHKFEYLDLLKDIYLEVLNSTSVPYDAKDILVSTIEDILSQNGETFTNEPQQRVSSLTSLSYSTSENEVQEENEQIAQNEPIQEEIQEAEVASEEIQEEYKEEVQQNFFDEIQQEEMVELQQEISPIQNEIINEVSHEQFDLPQETKLSAFDAFGASKNEQEPHQFFSQSPFSAQPFEEFNYPEPSEVQQNYSEPTYVQWEENELVVQEEIQEEVIPEKKSVAIFYAQDNSSDKIKNILKLNDLIKNSQNGEIYELISQISTQADVNVVELQGVLEHLKNGGNDASLITNCQSANISELLEEINITYSFYKNDEGSKLNAIPLYGLSNLYSCAQCDEKYIYNNQGLKPYVLECPKCKKPMFVELYAPSEDAQINMEYYNEALINLANAEVWLLIHPSYTDKNSSNLLETALQVSSKVKEIYVLDKDINVRETYKNVISEIKPQVNVNAHPNTLEDFFREV